MSDPIAPTTLVAQVNGVEDQLGRADNKGALLLALFFGLAIYVADWAGRQTDRPVASVAAMWTSASLFLVAAFLVVWAVRPVLNLTSGRAYGFMAYIQCQPGPELHQAIADTHTEEALDERLIDLSWVAYRRHGRIRLAIHFAVAGLGVAVFSAILNAVLS